MATHLCVLAWEIPWTEEPVGLQSIGLQRVRHDLVTKEQQQTCYKRGVQCAVETREGAFSS